VKITVVNHVSLDGVMQAPAAADEDTRGGFAHGGWAVPYADQVVGEFMGRRMSGGPGAMLFGRVTYEHLYAAWHGRTDNPFTTVLDASTKFVVSNTLVEPLEWANSTLLRGDGAETVAALKNDSDLDATVLGSGELVRSLLRAALVDELVLTITPLMLGSGRRLFPDDAPLARFALVESIPTTTGVIIAHYRLDH
jgi:dihydrofolate reductase